jgi:shikimate kinase
LQRRIRVPLLDTDDIVASKFGMSIPEIFSRHGEEKFRQAETEALRNLPRTEQAIIVTGGGIVLRDENVDMLRELGVLIWLDGDEKALFKRASASANRPLLQGTGSRKAFARILRGRLPRYMNIAHVRIDTSMLTDEEVAVAVLSKLRRFDHNRELGSAMPATI